MQNLGELLLSCKVGPMLQERKKNMKKNTRMKKMMTNQELEPDLEDCLM